MKKLFVISITLMLCLNFFGCASKTGYNSWHLNNMNIDELWEYSKGSSQIIAFIDTGISTELANSLSDKIIYRYNLFDGSDDVADYNGHGTEIISVACGNGLHDVYGIAPNSKIIVIKAVSDDGKTNNDNLYQALKIAESQCATIVNISLGGYKTDSNVISQINKMIDNNITIVAAAGDYQNKDLLFPANQENVISVEALAEKGELWNMSNRADNSVCRLTGENIDVLTIDSSGQLYKDVASGTSQASAIASGYIALIRDHYQENNIFLDNDKLIEILHSLETKNNKNIDYLKPFLGTN